MGHTYKEVPGKNMEYTECQIFRVCPPLVRSIHTHAHPISGIESECEDRLCMYRTKVFTGRLKQSCCPSQMYPPQE